jgi:hypothetical protein
VFLETNLNATLECDTSNSASDGIDDRGKVIGREQQQRRTCCARPRSSGYRMEYSSRKYLIMQELQSLRKIARIELKRDDF